MKKFLYMLFTTFLAISLIFLIVRLAPGDPVEKILGPEATEEEKVAMTKDLGLDQSISTQYMHYLKGLFKGDLGKSLFENDEVVVLIKKHFPPTFYIALISIVLAFLWGTYFGVLAGFKQSGTFDFLSRVISLGALSFPIFSLAPILVYVFSIKLNLLPVSEWGGIAHSILPILTLTIPLGAIIMRVTRNKYLEEFSAQWVQVLRAKGISEFQILLRIFKVCLPSILNVVAIQISVVLAGTMITETIFDIPGMGTLLFEGIQNRDYPLVQGVILYSTLIYMITYFVIDNLNTFIDPRLENER